MSAPRHGESAEWVDGDEHAVAFGCFGGTCDVHVAGAGPLGPAAQAARAARRQLLAWHDEFTRFEPGSALSRLNADPAATVPVGLTTLLLVRAIVHAGSVSGGLVDATLVGELESAGYATHRDGPGLPLHEALDAAPPRAPARPSPEHRWSALVVDPEAGTVSRPPGLRIDGGGLLKGLFADLLGRRLAAYDRFVVNCCGDLRVGGRRGDPRGVRIESPFDERELHRFELADGAVATSGIGRRLWRDARGRPAHHLLDPATGTPAFTGVVQVSALAPTAVEAEWRSKAALLSGPRDARRHLPHGGLIVRDDGASELAGPGARPPAARAGAPPAGRAG